MAIVSGEVFPSAPLALVAAEVRYPAVAESALGMAVHRRIRDALGTDWVIHNEKAQTFEAGLGAAGPQAALRSETIARITSRRRTRIITVRPENFTLEVVDYVRFDDFRSLLERAAAAVESVLRPDGISRVGLRYINEVAVPETSPHWDRWLVPWLTPPDLLPDSAPTEWTGAVQYRVASEQSLVFRYGPSAGPVVSPTGPLRRLQVPAGPIFMLDFDSSWQPSNIPEFTADTIIATADRLRDPLRALFDSLLEPALLEVFRQEPTNE